MNYLYAAYAATWIIHVGYIGILARRYQRLKRAMESPQKDPNE